MAEHHRGDIVIVHLRVGLIVEDTVSQLATSRNSHYRGREREGEREGGGRERERERRGL